MRWAVRDIVTELPQPDCGELPGAAGAAGEQVFPAVPAGLALPPAPQLVIPAATPPDGPDRENVQIL